MAMDARVQVEEFKSSLEHKIKDLVAEFGEGKISREQFHIIYERYSSKLAIANHALVSGNPDAISIAQDGLSTIAMRSELMGKAMGLMIYHNNSGSPLETLGDFSVPVSSFAPTLNDISLMMQDDQIVERRVQQMGQRQWLVFVTGRYSTVVTEFRNEPSQIQYQEIERLHRDFENANRQVLQKEHIDSTKLAYPFIVFIQKKFGK